MRKSKLCWRTESNTESPSNHYSINCGQHLWRTHIGLTGQLSNLLAHAEVFNFLFLLTLYEKILGTKSGFGCYQHPNKKWNNKVNQAEKGAPADFSIWANVTRVNAPMGLNSATKVAKPRGWLIVGGLKHLLRNCRTGLFPKQSPWYWIRSLECRHPLGSPRLVP